MFGSAQHIEHLWGGTKAEIRTPIWQYFLTECTYERSPGWFWLKIHFRLVELCTNHHKSRFASVKFYYYCFFSLIGATAHLQLAVSLLLNSVSLSVWVIQHFIPFFFLLLLNDVHYFSWSEVSAVPSLYWKSGMVGMCIHEILRHNKGQSKSEGLLPTHCLPSSAPGASDPINQHPSLSCKCRRNMQWSRTFEAILQKHHFCLKVNLQKRFLVKFILC